MYLLDTNIVSLYDPRRVAEHLDIVEWMRRNDDRLHFSTVTLTEIELGILKLFRVGSDARARQLAIFRDTTIQSYQGRILPVTTAIALDVAHLVEHVRPMVIERTDLIIAATAKVHGLTVLTRNLRHFTPTGVPALDPVVALPPG